MACLLQSCEKNEKNEAPAKVVISGFVQKGPFLNGTTVIVAELNDDLSQTGKTFSAEILDNRGTFNLSGIELKTRFVELRANGYYFNEVSGQNSNAQITLGALAEITDTNSLNVNVLTHLEKGRIQFLVAAGLSFPDAKAQAQQEVLDIFEIVKPDMKASELLDVSKDGEDNAILLAISALLQGTRTEATLSELLANISTDIGPDGQLNNPSVGTDLINSAMFLDPETVRENLKEKYTSLGEDAGVPAIAGSIQQFIQNTDFEFTNFITYPDTGYTGPNLLAPGRTEYVPYPENSGNKYFNSITAITPGLSDISVKIAFTDTCDQAPPPCDSCISECLPCGQGGNCGWGIDAINSGWAVDLVAHDPMTFLIYKDFSREKLDLKINLTGHGKAYLEIFENKSTVPTHTKTITW